MEKNQLFQPPPFQKYIISSQDILNHTNLKKSYVIYHNNSSKISGLSTKFCNNCILYTDCPLLYTSSISRWRFSTWKLLLLYYWVYPRKNAKISKEIIYLNIFNTKKNERKKRIYAQSIRVKHNITTIWRYLRLDMLTKRPTMSFLA